MNLLDSASNQPFKSKTRNCVKTNDDACGTHNINTQTKFKTRLRQC